MKPAAVINALTGLRFPLALAVVLYHLRDKVAECIASPAVYSSISYGDYAVPFFFTLSGFILMHVYAGFRLADHGHFIWLRIARLWPVHVVTLAGMALYVAGLTLARGYVPDHKYDFSVLLSELSLTRSWHDARFMWNGPAWSIQIEFFAYLLLFPVCALTLRRITSPLLLVLLAVLSLWLTPLFGALPDGRTYTIVAPFIVGAIAYRLRCLLPDLVDCGLLVCLGMLASVLAIKFCPRESCALPFAVVIFALSYEQGWIARLLATRPLVYGGEISFALYMAHNVVNTWTWELWGQIGAVGLWTVVGTLAVSILAAVAVHHLVELPANRWLRAREPRFVRQPSKPVAA